MAPFVTKGDTLSRRASAPGLALGIAGLPGPRGRVLPRLPAGLESRTGVEVSAVDATLEGLQGPDYGQYEIGAGVQLTVVGLDVGVEPFEFLDFLAGWVLRDPAQDDF